MSLRMDHGNRIHILGPTIRPFILHTQIRDHGRAMLSFVRTLYPPFPDTKASRILTTQFSGYKYGNDGHVCSSTITHGRTFTYVQYTTDGLNLLPGSTVATKFLANIPVWGDGVPIWCQSSDAEVLAKAAAMISTIPVTSTPPTRPTSTPAIPTTPISPFSEGMISRFQNRNRRWYIPSADHQPCHWHLPLENATQT
ncbi:hypothetical protein PTT_13110 [Pyrenophora teres f. teres 0-1]|uniref:Uncharacterized protein n=1 Tax=Pyrenophora teres f. teres (strain 0-1) TaxID=861557 RepID=E3RVB9_PYRTT|nr:hypothetical protein PTT_13110 [Pyrenophora teres f. teres 0-1]